MVKYSLLAASIVVLGCANTPETKFLPEEVDFMFNDYEERSFDYPFGEYPKHIIDSILIRSADLDIEVRGITAMAWGFHPMAYVIYTEEKAYISFFYWGNTAGKGYINEYSHSELELMNAAIFSEESCTPYSKEKIDWVDIHIFKKDSGYIICSEGGAFFGGGKIREYFGSNFDERIQWVKYSYGN